MVQYVYIYIYMIIHVCSHSRARSLGSSQNGRAGQAIYNLLIPGAPRLLTLNPPTNIIPAKIA